MLISVIEWFKGPAALPHLENLDNPIALKEYTCVATGSFK